MLPYCLKGKKILRVLIQKFLQLIMVKQWHYQSVLYLVLKNQNLVKNKKPKHY